MNSSLCRMLLRLKMRVFLPSIPYIDVCSHVLLRLCLNRPRNRCTNQCESQYKHRQRLICFHSEFLATASDREVNENVIKQLAKHEKQTP